MHADVARAAGVHVVGVRAGTSPHALVVPVGQRVDRRGAWRPVLEPDAEYAVKGGP
jgi:hypothetical protein